jgi:pimeloyl-ACP methyl ester carboxylesterase
MDWQSLLLIKRNLGFSLYPMVPKMQTKLQNQGKIIEVPFIEVEDGRLYYDVSSKRPSLVLIHGAWASREWWRWQVPELSKDYQVLSLDVRGHGQSSPLRGAYSVDGFAEDLEIFLKEIGHVALSES